MIRVPDRFRGPRRRGEGEEETAERNQWVADRLKEGHSVEEVASAVGISAHTVIGIRGKFFPRVARRKATSIPGRALKRNYLPVERSFAFEIRRGLSEEAQKWLIEQCPNGVTMGAFIASIITDAYLEETEDGA